MTARKEPGVWLSRLMPAVLLALWFGSIGSAEVLISEPSFMTAFNDTEGTPRKTRLRDMNVPPGYEFEIIYLDNSGKKKTRIFEAGEIPAPEDMAELIKVKVVSAGKKSVQPPAEPEKAVRRDTQPEPVEAPVDTARIEEAKGLVSKMAEALKQKNAADMLAAFAPDALVTIQGRRSNVAVLRQILASALPLLDDVQWSLLIQSATIDPKTGNVRVRVSSSYSAKLMEPVGVTRASLAKPDDVKAFQMRLKESMQSSADEIYEFKPPSFSPSQGGTKGGLQLVEMVSGLPLGTGMADKIAGLTAAWQVKVAVFGLFDYMEQNALGKLAELISDDFTNNDDNGFHHNRNDFIESLKADLDHLTEIDHTVRVDDIQINSDRTQARVPVTWDRRARISNTKSEWVVKNQKTTMTFRRAAGLGFGLAQIEGNPIFGNSSRLTRKTLIRTGEVDGGIITKAIVISDSRDTAVANSADIPEMPRELVSTLGVSSEVSGGSISSNPSVDQTWKGNITITTSITIPSGVTITVSSGAVLSIADNATITVNGTLNATSATFKKQTTAWGGLLIASGSAVTLTSCTLQDADTIIVSTAASPTIQNSMLYPTRCAINVRTSGSPTITGNTFTSASGSQTAASAVIVGPNATASVTFRNNTVSKFGNTGNYNANFFVYVGFTGTVTSSGNRFTGDHAAFSGFAFLSESDGGTFTFTNDVYTEYFVAIENRGGGPDFDAITDGTATYSMTFTNCDFTHNNTRGLRGGNQTGDGVPSVVLNGCFFQNNNGAHNTGRVSQSTADPDDDSVGGADDQYTEVSSVSNARSSANN